MFKTKSVVILVLVILLIIIVAFKLVIVCAVTSVITVIIAISVMSNVSLVFLGTLFLWVTIGYSVSFELVYRRTESHQNHLLHFYWSQVAQNFIRSFSAALAHLVTSVISWRPFTGLSHTGLGCRTLASKYFCF